MKYTINGCEVSRDVYLHAGLPAIDWKYFQSRRGYIKQGVVNHRVGYTVYTVAVSAGLTALRESRCI